MEEKNATRLATFGGGCFWCTEAAFKAVEGVVSVVPGYAGGTVKDPSYEDVCSGRSGHAEVVQVRYDPSVVSYERLLEVFWLIHDPTTVDRQGNDSGPQYRSVVFWHDKEQKKSAEESRKRLDESGAWGEKVVTAIEPLTTFYEAEEYHHDYFARNPGKGYCRLVIRPKMDKFLKALREGR
jgi:peptide-methionine (S)-S-oxide reductase